jgi:hypothetical protein
MSDFESQITTMLQDRAAAARPIHRLDAVLDDVTEIRVVTPHRDRDWRPLLAVAAALVLVVGGLVALTRRGADSPVAEPGQKFSFVTQQVSLTADDFWIEIGGKRFTSSGAKVEVHSDAGVGTNHTYQTLELVWHEGDVEVGVNFYFGADSKQWWSDSILTRDSSTDRDDVTLKGDFFRSKLGSPFMGTFDESATFNGVTGHMHIAGMRLQAFLDRGPGGVTVATSSTLLELDMSKVTAPPLPDGLPVTGAAISPEDGLVIAMAQQVLIRECMIARGWKYPTLTDDQWASSAGGWSRAASGRVNGYHLGDTTTDPISQFIAGLSASDQQRFSLDQDGAETDSKVLATSPDGSPTMSRLNGGCFGQMASRFGASFDQQMVLPNQIMDAFNRAAALAPTDAAVVATSAAWSTCVQAAVGETAKDPVELAQHYEFVAGGATDHEKLVAVADATCQQQTDYWTVYQTAFAKAERILLGKDVNLYDDLTRANQDLANTSRQILAEHNITPPSLD